MKSVFRLGKSVRYEHIMIYLLRFLIRGSTSLESDIYQREDYTFLVAKATLEIAGYGH